MSIVVEVTLSLLLERLIEGLLPLIPQLGFRNRTAQEVKKWSKILDDLRFVLRDADEKKSGNSEIEGWIEDLKYIAYDVEDILDELDYDMRMNKTQGRKRKRGVLGFLSPVFDLFIRSSEVPVELQSITDRLNDIVDRRKRLRILRGDAIIIQTHDPSGKNRHSGPLTSERKLHRREAEKKKIIEFLTRNDGGEDNIGVIPIVGAGGIGKTTLAKQIYGEIRNQFEVNAWVGVSNVIRDSERRRIFQSVLSAVPLSI